MGDPLPLLPFTYAICMVVSSIVLMTMMMAVSGDGGGFSTDICLIWGGLLGYTSQSSWNSQNKRKQSKTNFI